MKIIFRTLLILILSLCFNMEYSEAQIIAPTGISSRATSQLVFYYDNNTEDPFFHITNTNDTEGVWVHVQMFMNDDVGNDDGTPDIICVERDFVDFLTPNDTHKYDIGIANFAQNLGESLATEGQLTSVDITGTTGFIVVTPVVSNVDFSAISFQHLIGVSTDDSGFLVNAMGRDAVDFATGDIVGDNTVLDGVSNGFLLLQPEEVLLNFHDITSIDVIGIVFEDSYGPAGLLGYNVLPGDAVWTPFIFDFRENPTSCGATPINCFLTHGLNDTITQNSDQVTDGELCEGTITPDDNAIGEPVGWVRIFVSGLGGLENHISLTNYDTVQGADLNYTKGERTDTGGPTENCAVAGDEDGDMLADCADPDCDGETGPNGETCEAVEATCDDGFDNDGDGATDGADTDCDGSESCPSCESGDQCSDGEDNDGDGNSDCADGGCDGATGPNGETCEAGVELTCNDNQDNDGDGTVDCDDPDCAIATNCIAGEGGGGGGCSVASAASPSMLNFLLPLIVVGLVIGIRRKR